MWVSLCAGFAPVLWSGMSTGGVLRRMMTGVLSPGTGGVGLA
jgi:hypothetical protein